MEHQEEVLLHLTRPLRLAVLRALLYVTIVGGIFFIGLNSVRGSYVLASAELIMVLYAAWLLFRLRRRHKLEGLILGYLVPFFSVMMLALLTPETSVTIFGWVLLIPILSHLLLGRHLGLMFSLFFMSIAAGIFVFQHIDDPALMDVRSLTNMVVLSGCIVACSHVYEIRRERSELQLAATARTDFLTGLSNRLEFSEAFERERKRARREGSGLALLLIDLDHFKRVNDRYGHEVGDMTLVHVARTLQERLRDSDLLARLGGEEFGLLLVHSDDAGALRVARTLCDNVAQRPLQHEGREVRITLSAGVSMLGRDGDSLQSMLAAADRRLFQAKDSGRNQVVAADSAEDTGSTDSTDSTGGTASSTAGNRVDGVVDATAGSAADDIEGRAESA